MLKQNASWKQTVKRNASVEAKCFSWSDKFLYPYTGEISDQFRSHIGSIYPYEILIQADWHFTLRDKRLSWQIGSGWRFTEWILCTSSWLIIHDFGKSRSRRDTTMYSTVMKPKLRNLQSLGREKAQWSKLWGHCMDWSRVALLGERCSTRV
jgi:hypothetical protein